MSSFNIDLVDKSAFVCLKFTDNSVYFGEIAYLDQDDKVEYSLDHIED